MKPDPETAGHTVELPSGRTHVKISGEPGGTPVVLVHGLTSSKFIWHDQVPPLIESGCRVLRYDLLGRGRSDRPPGPYTTDRFVGQLEELLRDLEGFESVALAGLSMGGAIAAAFTRRHPGRVNRLALIAPAGLRPRLPLWVRLLLAPGLGEFVAGCAVPPFLRHVSPRNLSSDPEKQRFARRRLRLQLEIPGYPRALLSTLREGPLHSMKPTYRAVGERGPSVRVFWSRTDPVVPFRLHRDLLEAIPRAQLFVYDRGRHTINFDRPELVNPPLVSFLGGFGDPSAGGTGGRDRDTRR